MIQSVQRSGGTLLGTVPIGRGAIAMEKRCDPARQLRRL
jgi:hypothetical protein